MPDNPDTWAAFESRFATAAACREYLIQLRWPNGFCCPRCGGRKSGCLANARFECRACGAAVGMTG